MAAPFVINYYSGEFHRILNDNLDLYWQTKRFSLDNKTTDLVSKEDGSYKPVKVIEIADWKDLKGVYLETAIDPEIEKIIEYLAKQAASSIEFLLRQESAKYGKMKDVRNIYASDVFKFRDGSDNLKLNIITNAPPSVADPAAELFGWIAYRFAFACGFHK